VEKLLKAGVSTKACDEARMCFRRCVGHRSCTLFVALPALQGSCRRFAVRRGVVALLTTRVCVNRRRACAQEGNTALHNAANQGHTEVIRLLLMHGARIDARTKARRGARVCTRGAARCGVRSGVR
jgi:hypothetical protein